MCVDGFGGFVPLGFLGVDVDVEPWVGGVSVEMAEEGGKRGEYHSLYSAFQTAL